MRDILTVLASLVILVLAAALIAPPLMDWESRRAWIDGAISRASGTSAETDGAILVRLLPSPRLEVDTLRVAGSSLDAPSLRAQAVTAELELTPLLSGELRFREARAARAEIRLPLERAGSWSAPAVGPVREWSIANLRVDDLLLTTIAGSGRTDQFHAEGVVIEGQRLAGPWRVEGTTRGVPFRVVTGEIGPDGALAVKFGGGGADLPRLDVDARVAFGAAPSAAGTARLAFGPPAGAPATAPEPGRSLPVTIQSAFKAEGGSVAFDQIAVDGGEGAAGLRLTGTASLRIDDPRLALRLEGRRLDLDGLLQSLGIAGFPGALEALRAQVPPLPVDLALTLSSIALGGEELADAAFRGTLSADGIVVEEASLTAPGNARLSASGEIASSIPAVASGRVAVSAAASDRLARWLERLGLRGSLLTILDGKPLEASAELALADPVISFRSARLRLGDATLSGSGRFTAPEGANRGRLDAQVALQGLDLATLPQASLFEATRHIDLGFTLDARNVRYGTGRSAGRITARILSDGPALVVETLEVTDIAGANARVAGRIAPDGTGRIAGKVTAARAAPLVDLLGAVWIGGVSRLVPPFLREGALDLDLVAERAPADMQLRTSVRGTAAGGRFEGEGLTSDGATRSLAVRIATDNTGRWIGRPDAAAFRRPSQLDIRGTRDGLGPFSARVTGELAGVRIATIRPFALTGDDDLVDSGEAEIATADFAPFLALLGEGTAPDGATPVQARVTFGRERDAATLSVSGRVANEGVEARLAIRSRADVTGNVAVDRLSLPWLVSALALNAPPASRPGLWSPARFLPIERPVTGAQVSVRARRATLGRGFEASEAGFTLGLNPDGLAIRGFSGAFLGGRLSGSVTVTRNGAQASVAGEGTLATVPIPGLTGPTPIQGVLSGTLRYVASADSVEGLVANLGGSGEMTVTGLRVPNADPAALARALPRLLNEDDPLAVRRLAAVIAEELDRAPFQAPPVTAPATIVTGALRLSPFIMDGGAAIWQGVAGFDAKTSAMDARGTMTARGNVRGWTGSAPFIGLNWSGTFRDPVREIDTGALNTGVAAIVLQRELAKIEAFEVEGNERQRRANRLEMDRQRERDRIAAAEAARQARVREEAERRAAEERARIEAERRAVEERARVEAERRAAEERARAEAVRRAAEERARIEAERRAAEERARQEAERRAAEERARIEAARRAEEERLRVAAERRAAEEAARQAQARAEAERAQIAARRAAAEAARQERFRAELERMEAARQERLHEGLRNDIPPEPRAEPSALPPLGPPIDIPPPPSIRGWRPVASPTAQP